MPERSTPCAPKEGASAINHRRLLLAAALAAGVGACSSHGTAQGGEGGSSVDDGDAALPTDGDGHTGSGGASTTGMAGGSGGESSPPDSGRGGGGTDARGEMADAAGIDARAPADASLASDARAISDAAATDVRGQTDAGGRPCAGLFCEDFEQGVIDPAIWDVKVNGGQQSPDVVTQPGLVAHGTHAAHFRANPNVASYDFIITKNPPSALRGHHFGRAYFMITPMPPANHTEYIYAGTTGFPQVRYLEVASAAPLVWQLTFVNEVPPNTGEDYHSGGTVPVGKWFCIEWEFNDSPDQAAVYVGGIAAFTQNAFTFNGASTGLVGGFAAFGFGYYAWHPATYPFDVYYDDIVLDTKRVGCLD